ncbi:MAG: dihydroorotate dehydrogenase electron transfer subunit [Candidatus Methylomirabilota bacterium]|nr:dihydroorotate dehydrogenase electron transfer subunit [Candidatus Methylomirabilis sp.]PWB45808.1 MAG: dihydroorotate dehydrogenase electron transfer subunit [candidate division NC10 bacterium]
MVVSSEFHVEIVANKQIAPEYFSMRLAGPVRLARFLPGQFLMLGWTDGLDPLLPRAMSIRRARRGEGFAEVEILYKVCGRGTARLAAMRPGRSLRATGPLGNGFEVPRKVAHVILVAGGVGVPPIAALVDALAGRMADRRIAVTVLLGGRSKVDLLCVSDLRRAGAAVHVATEDGSAGHEGLVTDLLKHYLYTQHPTPNTRLYACGPYPMLAALAPIAEQYDLPYHASMEANMACGFGACMGCVVPVTAHKQERAYRLVCKDGPVFDGHKILWDEHKTGVGGWGLGVGKLEGRKG